MKHKNVSHLIVGKPCWSPATSWRRAIWTTMIGVESKDVTKIEAANPIWRWKMEASGYLTISSTAYVKCMHLPFCCTTETRNGRNRWRWSPKHWILTKKSTRIMRIIVQKQWRHLLSSLMTYLWELQGACVWLAHLCRAMSTIGIWLLAQKAGSSILLLLKLIIALVFELEI